MRILQISPQVPFPLTDGGKVGIFNITKHLALRGHRITLLALDSQTNEEVRPLQEYCRLVRVPHSGKNSLIGAIQNLVSDLPYNVAKYRSSLLQDALKDLLSKEKFDIVHVDHLHMAHYGLFCRRIAGVPIVLREHNIESTIMERYLRVSASPFLRRLLKVQLNRIRRYEARMAGEFDVCCVITRRDEAALKDLQPEARIAIIPAGVEERLFEKSPGRVRVPNSLALVGDFEWGPNADSLHWFVGTIFPQVLERRPETRLHLIGKNIPNSVLKRGRGNIVARGLVPDFRDELRQYDMLVVPLRVGGGIRLKILESFAMGVPVVSTAIGCEGIEAAHEEHLLVADTDESFAVQILRMFEDSELRERLERNAYSLASQRYRWEHVGQAFESMYEDTIRRLTATRR